VYAEENPAPVEGSELWPREPWQIMYHIHDADVRVAMGLGKVKIVNVNRCFD
jgi:hypothetical protein